jgi:hypothetical protein
MHRKKRQSKEALESVDRLFNQPFEPIWMKWDREAKEMAATKEAKQIEKRLRQSAAASDRILRRLVRATPDLVEPIKDRVDKAWRISAQLSRERISTRCNGAHYCNSE